MFWLVNRSAMGKARENNSCSLASRQLPPSRPQCHRKLIAKRVCVFHLAQARLIGRENGLLIGRLCGLEGRGISHRF